MSEYINERSLARTDLPHNHHQYHSDTSSSPSTTIMASTGGTSGDEEDDEFSMPIDLRRGTWTVDEDHILMSYIAKHGEGRWNSLARCAGLKRTGKSCRLRWLNYLRPDVRHGNISLEEQLLILELHSRWGNRWSKIAQHLPGRTDNEIKNYWRTRVQKHAKQLKCDVNSKQFKDTMRYLWIPRLVEQIQSAAATGPSSTNQMFNNHHDMITPPLITTTSFPSYGYSETSSNSFNLSPYQNPGSYDYFPGCNSQIGYMDSVVSPQNADFRSPEQNNNSNNVDQWAVEGGDLSDNVWNVEDIWLLQQQQFSNNYLN